MHLELRNTTVTTKNYGAQKKPAVFYVWQHMRVGTSSFASDWWKERFKVILRCVCPAPRSGRELRQFLLSRSAAATVIKLPSSQLHVLRLARHASVIVLVAPMLAAPVQGELRARNPPGKSVGVL